MIYLDHAATGLPRSVDAMRASAEMAGLPSAGRGRHRGQAQAVEALNEARAHVAALVGGGTTVFTSGSTYGLNQAISGLTLHRALIDPLAHDSARLPLVRANVQVQLLPHDEHGRVDLAKVAKNFPESVDVVVITHGSNVNGVVQPVAELTAIAHKHGAKVIVDAAQTVGVIDTKVLAEADIVCFSAHKGLRALPGCGALVIRGDIPLRPLTVGGTGFGNNLEDLPYPERLEAGTLNQPGAVAMGRAAATHEAWDSESMTTQLKDAVRHSDMQWHGDLPTVSFTLKGHDPAVVEDTLDRAFDIVCRSGRHCAKLAHDTLKTGGTVRVSAGAVTTPEDLASLSEALESMSRATP